MKEFSKEPFAREVQPVSVDEIGQQKRMQLTERRRSPNFSFYNPTRNYQGNEKRNPFSSQIEQKMMAGPKQIQLSSSRKAVLNGQ